MSLTKRIKLLYLLVFLAFAQSSKAQFIEYGIGIGGANYDGDITSPEKLDIIKQTHVAFNGFLKISFNEYFGLRTSFLFTQLSGDDSVSPAAWQVERNLSFRSSIFEIAEILEINILGERKWSPYVMGGVGLFHYNPQAFYQGDWVDLRPLGTEGQGLPELPNSKIYSKFSYNFIIGGGLKLKLSDRLWISGELSARLTGTDYIDDVSGRYVDYFVLRDGNGQLSADLANRVNEGLGIDEPNNDFAGQRRGNEGSNDFYYVGLFRLHIFLNDFDGLGGGRRKYRKTKTHKCPTF